MLRILAGWLLVAGALAGCTGAPESSNETPDEANDAPLFRVDPVRLGAADFEASDTLSGTFAFTDNDQYAGEAQRRLGQAPDNWRFHDLSNLLPSAGLFAIEVTVDADPGGGDIDAWFEGDGIIVSDCECPFGGHNVITGHGLGGFPLTLSVQYDEISSGPDDPDVAAEGFDYTVDIVVRSQERPIPPGIPVAVRLTEPGDYIAFANHTEPISVFSPNDEPVATIGADNDSFMLANGMPGGEYVFIQQENGAPYDAAVWHMGDNERRARALPIDYAWHIADLGLGTTMRTTFDAPATVIAVLVCAGAGEATAFPSVEITRPDGEIWAGMSGDIALLGWGGCFSNWIGAPDQQPGTWTVTYTEQAGEGVEIAARTGAYVR